ncbi:hypothetical protein GH714_019349 [Hevea brasiliensis]|uniref:Reverse transcriptase RNase H-like domain-containing protein n=1 Tax=Hevea brasiliensis TaxID=3981 RepID=A0A6A6MXY4_HEVBR|nr:hypothetical protein GH714_019014 [Hevea brasiliensis]KAF2317257.1 hypothetical protein GH714_019126 [Hevea brasiliensis]KAF2317282.1 hypothetical protein GH714_019349 [Hevea brasiliensis]
MGTTTELDEAHFSCLELPLYSIGGIQQPRTMKFQGSIAGHLIVVMVDSSAGHNFISTQLQLLNLSISATPTFNVKLGDGCKISSTAMLWPVESDSEITKAGDELDDEQKEHVNRKKCSLGQISDEYLGHVISVKGVAMDPAKVSSILRWPTPKTVKVVRGFLGLTGYYRRFILNHGQLARPLTTLLKKENQGSGVGVVLMQQNRSIAFFSKAIFYKSTVCSAYERELMALVLAIQHWRPYLIGQKFIVRTDHRSLKYLLFQQGRLAIPSKSQWIPKLISEFHDTPSSGHSGAYRLSSDGIEFLPEKNDESNSEAQVLLLLLTQDHSKFILEGGRKRQGVYYTAANRQGEYYTAGNGRWREISRKEHVAESSYSNGRKTEYKGLRIEQKDLERTG